jgi:integrase
MPTLQLRPARAKTAGAAFRLLLARTEAKVAAGVLSQATLEMQRTHAEYLLEHLAPSTRLEELTPRRIVEVLQREARGRRHPLSANTLKKRASTLSQALELARGRAPKLPEIPYRYEPRGDHLPDFASYERLRDAVPPERRMWFVVVTWTGQRVGDAQSMRREDVDLERRSVRIRSTKTKKTPKWFHAAPELLRELADYLPTVPAGARLVEPWPSACTTLPKICRRLGLPHISPHGLRHTFFTWYVAANGFTPELLELGGWKDLTIPVRVYAHAAPPRLQEQIERTHAYVMGTRSTPRETRESETVTATVANDRGSESPVRLPDPIPAHVRPGHRQGEIVVLAGGDCQPSELVGPAGFEPAAYGLKVQRFHPVTSAGRPWKPTGSDHARIKT